MKSLRVAGARPNFMKIAPIVRALSSRPHAGITTSRDRLAEDLVAEIRAARRNSRRDLGL